MKKLHPKYPEIHLTYFLLNKISKRHGFTDGVDGYEVEKKEFGKCFGTDEFIEGTTCYF